MAITPFHDVPKSMFLGRMIRPAIFVFFIGFVAMGILSATEKVNLPALEMARYQYGKLSRLTSTPPEVCKSGEAISDFQKERCGEYQEDVMTAAFWSAMPFLVVLVFFLVALKALNTVYGRSEQKLSDGAGVFLGKLTDPPEMPNDLFGWSFCLQSVTVDLGKKKQLRVYLPVDCELPKPGSQLAIVDIGRWFSRTRYVAAPYMPHVAVFKG